MKKIFMCALSIFIARGAVAQNNYFNNPGNVGLGTSSPTSLLHLNYKFAQLKLQGTDATWLNSDIVISRASSASQQQRSPNIQFLDEATNTASYIQSYQGNLQFFLGTTQALALLNNGMVGVGTSSPYSMFQVASFSTKFNVGSASTLGGSSYIGFNAARYANGNWHFDGAASYLDGGAVIYADMNGNINFAAVPSLNGVNYAELTDDQLKSRVYFQVNSTGLARAKKLKIETANFPDYVFAKDYQLPSLKDIGLYIDKNHRLPEMPAAKEVETDGMDVGELNKLLVKKVEELTLYLIERDKEAAMQKKALQSLNNRLKKIERRK